MKQKFKSGFFGILLLLALAASAIIIATFVLPSSFSKQNDPSELSAPSPKIQRSSPAVSPSPSPTGADETANWELYTNQEFGYELKYPPNWNVLGPYGGDYNDLCTENPQNKPIIIFSIEKPEYCGFVGEFLPPGEANLTIVTGSKYETLEGIVSDNYEKITLSGENAVKYPFTETSDLPNVQATRIYLNHNSRGYLIFIKQIDKKGNYEPLFNQILSTFKFFD